jgi:hypothetical protein
VLLLLLLLQRRRGLRCLVNDPRLRLSPVLHTCEQTMNRDRRGSCCCDGLADGLERRRTAVVRSGRMPLVFLMICLSMLLANIGMIHRYACAKDDKTLRMLADPTAAAATNEFRGHRHSNDTTDNNKTQQQQEEPVPPAPVPVDQSGGHYQMPQIVESPSTNNRVDKNDESMSACLLIKDDNDILNEWLAYHYHAIKLRYLVVAIDPSSEESPSDILDRWRNRTDLAVELWTDADFMPKDFMEKGYVKAPHEISGDAKTSQWHEGYEDPEQVIADTMKILNHRHRQVTFLSRCLGHLKGLNKKLVMHIDTDEYVVVNPLLRNATQDHQIVGGSYAIRDIRKPSSVFELLLDLKAIDDLRQKTNYPCLAMPRLLFGSIVHQGEVSTDRHFNATLFETLSWLRHTSLADKERNSQPKVIIDVSAVSQKDEMLRKPFSIHRPSRRGCPGVAKLSFSQLQRYPITVNHYVGSWDRYNSRNDTRRSRRTYEKKAFVQDGYDNWITPWLDGFIETHGLNLTRELLAEYVVST